MLLHPGYLYGLAGLAAPVLIHLLARRRTRRVLFPSLRLLKAADRKRRTLARLRRPLSLLVRMAAIALLVMGLAAPVVGPLPDWLPLPTSRAMVVVLDDSLSMMGALPGEAPFSRARSAAMELVAEVGSGGRVAIVSTSSPGEAQWRSADEATEWLASRQPTAIAGKIAPALVSAADLLQATDAPNRVVAIITDLQATAWQSPPVAGADLTGVETVVVDAGDPAPTNIAVRDVWMNTPSPVAGRPVRLSALIDELAPAGSPADPRSIVVQFQVDGETVGAAEREVAPGVPAVADFSFAPDDPGDIAISVAVAGGPNGLAVDDVRWLTVRVRPAVEVLVVGPSRVAPYLHSALNPFDDPHRSGMNVTAVAADELTRETEADVVILADCPALSDSAQTALGEHVAAGGGVVVFLGDNADPGGLLSFLAGADVSIGDATAHPGEMALRLADVNTTRGPLRAFASPRAGDLGALRFTKARQIDAGPSADVLAGFDDGNPAIVHWRAAGGRVALLNMSADGSWGDHIQSPAYVPLLHGICGYVARSARPVASDATAGGRPLLEGAQPLPGSIRIAGPGGEVVEAVVGEEGVLPEVKEVGIYEATWDEAAARFAANVDAAESDLRRLDELTLRAAVAPAAVTVASTEDPANETISGLAQRADISWLLILGAIALTLVDGVFSLIRQEPDSAPGQGEWTHA